MNRSLGGVIQIYFSVLPVNKTSKINRREKSAFLACISITTIVTSASTASITYALPLLALSFHHLSQPSSHRQPTSHLRDCQSHHPNFITRSPYLWPHIPAFLLPRSTSTTLLTTTTIPITFNTQLDLDHNTNSSAVPTSSASTTSAATIVKTTTKIAIAVKATLKILIM